MTATGRVEPLNFFWFIPTHGDGTYLGTEHLSRRPEFRYFKQVAIAVDELGFEGVLLQPANPAKTLGLSRPAFPSSPNG